MCPENEQSQQFGATAWGQARRKKKDSLMGRKATGGRGKKGQLIHIMPVNSSRGQGKWSWHPSFSAVNSNWGRSLGSTKRKRLLSQEGKRSRPQGIAQQHGRAVGRMVLGVGTNQQRWPAQPKLMEEFVEQCSLVMHSFKYNCRNVQKEECLARCFQHLRSSTTMTTNTRSSREIGE